VRISIGLPGLWWVSLGWGEPVLPWWGHHKHRRHPRWDGWGGPRIVNNVVINQTTIINVGDIHYHNARHPRAILTAPADKFGRERVRITAETRYRHEEFAPLRGEIPVKPSRESLLGGAPKATQPPRDVLTRPVVTTRPPRERALPWKDEPARVRTEPAPESRYVKPPSRREMDEPGLPRPPFGAQAGPERTPSPPPPRLKELKSPAAPPPPSTTRTPGPTREEDAVRREAPAAPRPVQAPAAIPPQPQVPASRQVLPPRQEDRPARATPPRGEVKQKEQPLPGKPANQTYRGQEQKVRSWEERSGGR